MSILKTIRFLYAENNCVVWGKIYSPVFVEGWLSFELKVEEKAAVKFDFVFSCIEILIPITCKMGVKLHCEIC